MRARANGARGNRRARRKLVTHRRWMPQRLPRQAVPRAAMTACSPCEIQQSKQQCTQRSEDFRSRARPCIGDTNPQAQRREQASCSALQATNDAERGIPAQAAGRAPKTRHSQQAIVVFGGAEARQALRLHEVDHLCTARQRARVSNENSIRAGGIERARHNRITACREGSKRSSRSSEAHRRRLRRTACEPPPLAAIPPTWQAAIHARTRV